jgi:hypothetical protein
MDFGVKSSQRCAVAYQERSMAKASLADCGAQKRQWLVRALAALLLFALPALGFTAQSADPTPQAPPTAPEHPVANVGLPKVTIQANKELRREVHKFVAAVVTQPRSHESLLRWNKEICPLVVGLSRNLGEFILARISQAARDAHAPLAGEHCQPNLFVVVTAQPDLVLKQWMARNPRVDTQHGMAPLRSFLNSTQPVRVWYNPQPSCEGGAARPGSAAEMSSIGLPYPSAGNNVAAGPPGGMGPTYCDNSIDTHLTYGDVRSISYAIVVADTNKLHAKHVTLGQLADYVSLVGLVDVRSDTDGEGAPTILRLFHDPNPPHALTAWDRALLYSLYNTSQSGQLQLTDMEVTMVRRIAP